MIRYPFVASEQTCAKVLVGFMYIFSCVGSIEIRACLYVGNSEHFPFYLHLSLCLRDELRVTAVCWHLFVCCDPFSSFVYS